MHLQVVVCFAHFQDEKFHSVQFAWLKKILREITRTYKQIWQEIIFTRI